MRREEPPSEDRSCPICGFTEEDGGCPEPDVCIEKIREAEDAMYREFMEERSDEDIS